MSGDPRAHLLAVRRQLLFVVVASLVPAVLAAIALIGWDYYGRERERELRDSLATARAIAAAVDAELNGVKAALFALATSPYLGKDDFADFHRQATAALENQRLANIVLVDGDLRQHVNTFRPFGTPLPRQGNPEQLREVLRTGKPVITDLFVGPLVGQHFIAVGVPVPRAGRRPYVLAAGLTPARLSSILAQQHLPRDWVAAIFDSTGTIVARTHEPQRFIGQKGAPALVQRMKEIAEGTVQTQTLEGIPVISVFSRSPASGWTVAIGIPLSHFKSQLLDSLARLFIIAFVTLLVALALGVVIARRMTA